jgi:hypothetical protein
MVMTKLFKVLMVALFIGVFSKSFANTNNTPTITDIRQTKEIIEQKKEEKKARINANEYISKIKANPNGGAEFVPLSNGQKVGCKTESGKVYCDNTVISGIPVLQPSMKLIGKDDEPIVPQPKQYKNVFKLIATVMYGFAVIYFLVQISVEVYRKRFMQALVMLMMFLIGSSMLYVAYRSVFNTP